MHGGYLCVCVCACIIYVFIYMFVCVCVCVLVLNVGSLTDVHFVHSSVHEPVQAVTHLLSGHVSQVAQLGMFHRTSFS